MSGDMRHRTNAFVAGAAAVMFAMSPVAAHAADGIADMFFESLGQAWSFLTGAAETAGEAVTPPTPMDTLRKLQGEEKGEFWSMLEDAGYELKEIDTEVGLIPGIEATYILRRELSDADREALERRLELHAENNAGLISRLERAIIYALLDASELGEYEIEKLKVTFLPLPAASFSLAPKDAPLDGAHDRVFRAVRDVDRKLHHLDRESHRKARQAVPASVPR